MRLASAFLVVLCVVHFAAQPGAAQGGARPEVLPDGALRQAYYQQLQPPAKGTAPWHWRLLRGTLPPGIALERNGTLAGAPTAPGVFHFTVEAADSTPKAIVQAQDYAITVPFPMVVVWIQPPRVTAEGAIAGELQVSNGAGRTVDLTDIVVAVNTSNKASALGYERVELGPGSLRVPFGSRVPRDSYVVHADAIAEIAETGEIYHLRLQTGALNVP